MTKRSRLSVLVLATTISTVLLAETQCPGNVPSVSLRHANHYQLIVTVSLNNSGPYDFLLDTGTQVTMVDPSLIAGHLSADGDVTLAGVGFHESVSMVHLQELAVGTHAVSDQNVLVADFSRLKSAGLHIQGILGEDFLEHFDMLIDNSHGLLCLDETERIQERMRGAHIPLSESSQSTTGGGPGNTLIISVHFLNGMRPVRLMLDSGSNAPFLYGPSDYLAFGVTEGASWHGMG